MKANRQFVLSLAMIWTLEMVFSAKVGNAQPILSASICLVNNGHISKACQSQSHITCGDAEKIKIHQIRYYTSASPGRFCFIACNRDKKLWISQHDGFRNMDNFIYRHCSYKHTCDLSNSVYTPTDLQARIWFININYTCISQDDVVDVCSPMERNVTGELHLVTRSKPYNTCICAISDNARVTIPQYTPCYYDFCTKNNVSINNNNPFICKGSCVNTTFTFTSFETTGQVDITVTGVNSMMFFWLSVSETEKGVPTVVCYQPQSSPVSSTSIGDYIGDKTTEGLQDSPFPTAAVSGAVTVSVVAIVVVVVISILCVRRKHKRKQSTDDDPHYCSPQFQPNSTAWTSGITGQSNIAYEPQGYIIAGTNERAQAYNAEWKHSTSSGAGNEYSTIDQSDDTIDPSTNTYEAVDDNDGILTIDGAKAKFSKASQPESGKGDADNTYAEPYNEPGDGSTDVDKALTDDLDSYSHLNRSDNFSAGQGQTNYSHVNVAKSLENPGYYSHTNVTNEKLKDTVTDNFDNYSHVTGPMTQQEDTYAHLTLPVSGTKTGRVTGPSYDVYNHITIPATEHGSQNTMVKGAKRLY